MLKYIAYNKDTKVRVVVRVSSLAHAQTVAKSVLKKTEKDRIEVIYVGKVED